jgi:hypothetical protein
LPELFGSSMRPTGVWPLGLTFVSGSALPEPSLAAAFLSASGFACAGWGDRWSASGAVLSVGFAGFGSAGGLACDVSGALVAGLAAEGSGVFAAGFSWDGFEGSSAGFGGLVSAGRSGDWVADLASGAGFAGADSVDLAADGVSAGFSGGEDLVVGLAGDGAAGFACSGSGVLLSVWGDLVSGWAGAGAEDLAGEPGWGAAAEGFADWLSGALAAGVDWGGASAEVFGD